MTAWGKAQKSHTTLCIRYAPHIHAVTNTVRELSTFDTSSGVQVCNGNCASLTPAQQVQIDNSARNTRAVISCVDSAALAEDPFALPLPFTPGAATFFSARLPTRVARGWKFLVVLASCCVALFTLASLG